MSKKTYLAIYSGVFAAFYSFCLYKNPTGITFPLFVIGALVFNYLCTKLFSLKWKKDSIILAICAILIGLSQMFTDNDFINFMNIPISFALLLYIMLHQFAFDEKWGFFKCIENLLLTFFGAISKFFSPLSDLSCYQRQRKSENEKAGFPWSSVIISALITLPVMAIICALLSKADIVFKNMWTKVFSFDSFKDIILIILLTILVFGFVYGMVINLLRFPFSADAEKSPAFSPVIAITSGIMLDMVYVIFAVIQIFYLFIGNFSLPEGYSYAEYAREGFWELLAVCIINLILVLLGDLLFEENTALKIILTIMSLCTYVMTASSAFRMILYIRYYYFSFDRILVLWTLFVIVLLLSGLLCHIWKKEMKLFRYSVIVVSICYILLSFSRADYFIAKWNLELQNKPENSFFIAENGYNDYSYLCYNLSADAAPVMVEYADKFDKEYDLPYYLDLVFSYDTNIRSYNVSIDRAQKLFREKGY